MSKKRAMASQKSPTHKTEKKEEEQEEAQQGQKEEQKFSLYSLLQLEKGPKSTIDEIKKQYRKLVIVHHPDKNQGDEGAKEKFQKLKEAYDILSDPEKKQIYDETGTIGDNFDEKSFQTAYEYFRALHRKIEKEDIESFEKKYRHGDMEKEDLLDFYHSHGGNMVTLLECIPLSRNEDIARFIQFFEEKIKDKTLKKSKEFQKTKDKVRELVDETEQFQKQAKEREDRMKELTLAIRNKSNKSFLESLEQKYAPKKEKAEGTKSKADRPRRKTNKQ